MEARRIKLNEEANDTLDASIIADDFARNEAKIAQLKRTLHEILEKEKQRAKEFEAKYEKKLVTPQQPSSIYSSKTRANHLFNKKLGAKPSPSTLSYANRLVSNHTRVQGHISRDQQVAKAERQKEIEKRLEEKKKLKKLSAEPVTADDIDDDDDEEDATALGEGFGDIVNGIKNVARRVANVFTNSFSPATEKAVKKYGDYMITDARIHRNPVEAVLKKVLSLISGGKTDIYKQRYDDLYHLFMIIHMTNGQAMTYQLTEKRPNIVWEDRKGLESPASKGDYMDFVLPKPVLFRDVIELSMKKLGSNYHKYDAVTNNCQKYIQTLVDSMYELAGSSTPSEIIKYITQNLDGIIDKDTSKVANAVTDVGHFFNRLTGGEEKRKKRRVKFNSKNNTTKLFNKTHKINKKSKIDQMIDMEIDKQMNHLIGGDINTSVSNIGTSALKLIQDNVLKDVPIVGHVVDAVSNFAEPVITGITQKLLGIKPLLLDSAKHYEQTGQTGYETDLLNKGYGHGPNLNGNFHDGINFEVMRGEKSSNYNYQKHQQAIKKLEDEYLEKPIADGILPMPKRHSQSVLDKLQQYVDMGWIGSDNIEKYYDWNMIPADVPRSIPGTNYFEINDNPPKLAKGQVGGNMNRRRKSVKF